MEKITQTRLKQLLDYDPETGVFRHRLNRKGVRAGKVAGTVGRNGYLMLGLDRQNCSGLRMAWLYVHGSLPDGQVRPVNGKEDDCRFSNLKLAEGDAPDPRKGVRGAYRADDLRKKFGISVAQYQAMFVAQGGVCAACNNPETNTRNGEVKWLAVDHCHDTNRIRQLLCQSCNVTLGYVKDDANRLRALADYLERHRAEPGSNVVPLRSNA